MIIAELTLDHPLFEHTRTVLPEIEIEVQEAYVCVENFRQCLVQVDHHDFEAVETALRADQTVRDPVKISSTGNHRLYRLTLTERGAEKDLLPVIIEVGGVQLNAVANAEGWQARIRVPNREAFEQIHQRCLDYNIGLTVDRIRWETEDGSHPKTGITDAQHEALATAVECGYLEIPRKCSLTDLAAELGVSESAASERVRRGIKKAVMQVVDP